MSICKRYVLNDADAAHVLNDGFLKVFTYIDKYEQEKSFKSWIGRIIANTAIDHYRANLKFKDHDEIDLHTNIGNPAGVYDHLAYKDLLDLIRGLSPAYRTVFNLYAIDGYSHEEIAGLLKISVGTSKSNLFKARQKLQEKLLSPKELPEGARTGMDATSGHIQNDERSNINFNRTDGNNNVGYLQFMQGNIKKI